MEMSHQHKEISISLIYAAASSCHTCFTASLGHNRIPKILANRAYAKFNFRQTGLLPSTPLVHFLSRATAYT